MAARVSSTSSEEMASGSEDSASEDPINIAKGRGADIKEPEKAEIARTRKVQRNQAGGKKTVRGQRDPKVSAYQRVRENRNEFLSVTSKNMLRCDACKETISKKKSSVRKHINSVKHNDAKRAIQNKLELELAALIDGGSYFVTATYYLEGDGPLIFSRYERLASVSHSVAVDAYPNLEGVASRQANGNLALCNQLVTRTKQCISPGLRFFQRKK
ncbi:hypothetical protein AWC38_SpisGene7520 [Stylophora pistillata]|uniref:Uncharacterized protein n=1 Tax=Stylophora pistillata TaxID=50429 RepID=A0A2B4SG13_STYPI|nr:hypothetical protein AWC38_SpisGene7520 [Stylophora pistillata]